MTSLLPGSAPISPPSSPDSHGSLDQDTFTDATKLRSIHNTEGYRDGIANNKTAKIQQGFDEGYRLGAEVGARAGWILGVLESTGSAKLLEDANKELNLKELFGPQYFDEDGLWRWECTSTEYSESKNEDGKDTNRTANDTMTFEDIAANHPILKKWTALVEDFARQSGLDLNALEQDGDDPASTAHTND